MGLDFSQNFPPKPTFTESNIPSQDGKVFIVTGGYSGVGYELCKILYHSGAKIYIAGRSKSQALKAISEIESSVENPTQAGQLEFLLLELDDLPAIKAAAETFKAKESKLDVLWNNAGVSQPPVGSVSKQGIELQIAVNALGAYLFTQLLIPSLRAAAKSSPPGATRVVWTSSQMVDIGAPTGGMDMSILTTPQSQTTQYAASKTANWFLASELAKDVGPEGILSVTQNPGNLNSPLLRHTPWFIRLLFRPLLYPSKFGAYTELFAGLSPDLTMESNGAYIVPWGRVHPAPRKDLLDALKSVDEGGTGKAAEFRLWCEKMTEDYRK